MSESPSKPATSNRWEVALIVGLSTLLHAGAAAKAFQSSGLRAPAKRVSRVEIEMVRPPPKRIEPKPLEVPPPQPPRPAPPKPTEVKKKEPENLEPVAPVEQPPTAAPQPAPTDTGSSAPADAEGTLHAGSGGLGIAPPAPPAPPIVAPPAPPPIVQAREGANYLKNPRPAYPGRARREGWEGTTVLKVNVSPSGKPGAIQIQSSSGRDLLDEAAIEAVKGWTFAPATRGGEPISGWVSVPIVFRLQ